jgi:hypothetical protein
MTRDRALQRQFLAAIAQQRDHESARDPGAPSPRKGRAAVRAPRGRSGGGAGARGGRRP